MKTRRKFRLSGLLTLVVLSGNLAGCDPCEDTYCAPCSDFTNDVQLLVDSDSLQSGFRKSELNGAYIVRYARPDFAAPLDTVRQGRGEKRFTPFTFSLQFIPWPTRPAAPAIQDYTGYNYRLVLPRAGRTYAFSELDVESKIESEGCCNCPTNVRRRFALNGQQVVPDGSGPQAVTVLRR